MKLTIDGDDTVIAVTANDYAGVYCCRLRRLCLLMAGPWLPRTGYECNISPLPVFAGDHVITYEDTDATGVTGVVAATTEGSASVWVYADGSVSGYLPKSIGILNL